MNKHYTTEQTSQPVLRKTIIRLEHHFIFKGGAHSETSADLVIVKGSMFLGGAYPFALDVKGGE